MKGSDRAICAPFPTSKFILVKHDLSRDGSRELICLVEGDASLFSVVAPSGMRILSLKSLIRKEVDTRPERTRDLVFLKASYIP